MNRRLFMSAAALSPISIFASSTAPASEVEADDRITVQVTNARGHTKEFTLLHEGHVVSMDVRKPTKFRKMVIGGGWSDWLPMRSDLIFNEVDHIGGGQVAFWGHDIPASGDRYNSRPIFTSRAIRGA